MKMIHEQMELSIGTKCLPMARRINRAQRAQAWFRRMRRVVDQAMDWGAAAGPRAQQEFLQFCTPRR